MKLFNTLGHKIEEIVPNKENEIRLYTCGPTVYNFAHIGNLRTYISEDIIEKSLVYNGYNVKRCMNITDVGHLVSDADTGDDKMQVAVKREHKSALEIAAFYTDAFFKDLKALNIKKPEIISPATENVDEYIKIISKLLDIGYAYQTGGNVYFDTSKMPNYFELSGRNESDQIEAVRDDVTVDDNKKNKSDFVLWFTKSKFDSQELKWPSPFGEGYPGWHIECTGISIKYLGEYLDIHCGAIDAIFPHHTNEIAQSEAYLGHKWCNYWVHMEFLNDATGKMSKSKGEFLTLDLLKSRGYNPLDYRFLCLGSHYRKQLVFTYEALDGAKAAYNKLLNKIKNITEDGIVDLEKYNYYVDKFKIAINNDLNTSSALTVLYDVIKSDLNGATKLELIKNFDTVLSLDLVSVKKIDSDKVKYIEEMILKRNEAKTNKDYLLADSIRDELLKQNIIIKDTREGTTYEIL